MAYTVKIRTLPGSPMMCEYECEHHGRFEEIVERDEHGDPPPSMPCPHEREDETTVYLCLRDSELVVSAPNIKYWSRDPVALEKASKSDEKDPRMLDTEPLATGKMTMAEWKKYQHGITLERRHQKLLKSGKRQKRIQVGGG